MKGTRAVSGSGNPIYFEGNFTYLEKVKDLPGISQLSNKVGGDVANQGYYGFN